MPKGKITIPARILAKRGLRPGDELLLVEAAEGLLLYQHSTDPLTARWWSGLSEDGRRQAEAEAQRYENLSKAERDRIWEGKMESTAEDEAGNEVDLPAQ